jgi:hypothetical protein
MRALRKCSKTILFLQLVWRFRSPLLIVVEVVDKYGRKVKHKKAEDLKQYYELEDDECVGVIAFSHEQPPTEVGGTR